MLVVLSVAISEVLEDAGTNCLFRFMLRDSVDFFSFGAATHAGLGAARC